MSTVRSCTSRLMRPPRARAGSHRGADAGDPCPARASGRSPRAAHRRDRLRPSTVKVIASPGQTTDSGWTLMNCCSSASRRPHDGSVTGAPKPRYDRPASASTATAMPHDSWTMNTGATLGRRWRHRFCSGDEPRRAARQHEVAVQHASQLRSGHPRDVDAEADADRPDHDPERAAPHGRDHHRDDQHGEGDEDVDEHRHRLAQPPRGECAERGQRDADDRRDDPRAHGDQHRRARTGHEQAQDVAARPVRAEQVRPARVAPSDRRSRPAADRTASRTARRRR